MPLKDLQQIGLTKGEIAVYEAILKLGDCTKTALAKESGVAPSNIYDITNRLSGKGLISKVDRDKIIHFSPADPRHLLDMIDERKAELEQERQTAIEIIPKLMARINSLPEKSKVEVFQGWKGLKTIFDDLLAECDKGDTNFVFGASPGEQDEQADRFFLKYSQKREFKGIKTEIIFNESLKQRKERINFFLTSPAYKVRFLDQNTPTEVMVYKSTTCIIILTKEPLTIRVRSDMVAKSFNQFFQAQWSLAKPA